MSSDGRYLSGRFYGRAFVDRTSFRNRRCSLTNRTDAASENNLPLVCRANPGRGKSGSNLMLRYGLPHPLKSQRCDEHLSTCCHHHLRSASPPTAAARSTGQVLLLDSRPPPTSSPSAHPPRPVTPSSPSAAPFVPVFASHHHTHFPTRASSFDLVL